MTRGWFFLDVRDNMQRVRERVCRAAARAGRDPGKITIIAVTKQVDVSRIREALEAGITDLGENRVQEMTAKMSELPPGLRWHMIGHLQTNKVKYVVGRVDLIHSLDRWNLAVEINRQAEKLGVDARVLVQVNVSGEQSKFGISPGEAQDFLDALGDLKRIKVQGLMTIAPYVENPEEARPYFRELRLLARRLGENAAPGTCLDYLSMGMTGDFEVAVEEGANMIRLGTAIFGARTY